MTRIRFIWGEQWYYVTWPSVPRVGERVSLNWKGEFITPSLEVTSVSWWPSGEPTLTLYDEYHPKPPKRPKRK